jgi:hypothetical protein
MDTNPAQILSLHTGSNYNKPQHLPFGVYDGMIQNTSTAAWDQQSGMFSTRRTQRKCWIFFGVYSPELICGIAIADAGFFTNAFVYYYSFIDQIFFEDTSLKLLGFPKYFDPQLNSEWNFGKFRIHTSGNYMHLQYQGEFKIDITTSITDYGASTVSPSEGNRPFNFNYKNVCLPVNLKIKNQQKEYSVNGNYGSIDFSKGYPPRNTRWNWLSLIGSTESGKELGLNIVQHFNSDLENILWLDSQKIPLGSAHFNLQAPFKRNPWKIETMNKIVSANLIPAGARTESTNLLFLKSNFTQVFGKIVGEIKMNNSIEKFSAIGVAENHVALW